MIGASAAIVLACNALFQQQAVQSMSQALATMLATSAVWLWLKFPSNMRDRRTTMLAGLFVGLGYLVTARTTPFTAALHWHRPLSQAPELNQHAARQYAGAGDACCVRHSVCYLPHPPHRAIDIVEQSRRESCRGTLAVLRVTARGINAGTLTIGFASYPTTRSSEIRRYLDNVGRIGSKYREIFRVPWGLAFLLFALIGAVSLIASPASRHAGLVLLAPLGYLAVLPRYAVEASYLHGTLPSISLFAAVGIVGFFGWAVRLNKARWAIVCFVGGGLMISLLDKRPVSLDGHSRKKFRNLAEGRWYEAQRNWPRDWNGHRRRWHSLLLFGLRRGRLTPNDLPIVRAYAAKRYQGSVFLALSNILQSSYHPSVAALLYKDSGMLPIVVDLSDHRGRVVIFRLK